MFCWRSPGTTPISAAEPIPSPEPTNERAASAAWALLAPLSSGDYLAGPWVLHDLQPVDRGAAVLVVRHRGGRLARVHLCRNSGDPSSPAFTERFELLLINGGEGITPTEEPLAQALVVLAQRIEANTEAALRDHPELASLMTSAERQRAYDGTDALS